MSTRSIYNLIRESLNPEGKLSQNFALPFEETSPNELRFMPGAKDGIGIFHLGSKHPENLFSVLKDIACIEVNSDTKKNMKKLLKD
jgi:hypothetical protein